MADTTTRPAPDAPDAPDAADARAVDTTETAPREEVRPADDGGRDQGDVEQRRGLPLGHLAAGGVTTVTVAAGGLYQLAGATGVAAGAAAAVAAGAAYIGYRRRGRRGYRSEGLRTRRVVTRSAMISGGGGRAGRGRLLGGLGLGRGRVGTGDRGRGRVLGGLGRGAGTRATSGRGGPSRAARPGGYRVMAREAARRAQRRAQHLRAQAARHAVRMGRATARRAQHLRAQAVRLARAAQRLDQR
ncbi:MAG: hypothetical protein DIU60_023290, partial [Actinomycetes bacterium]